MRLHRWITAAAIIGVTMAAGGCSGRSSSPAEDAAVTESSAAMSEEAEGPAGTASGPAGDTGYGPAGPEGGKKEEPPEPETLDYDYPGFDNSGTDESKTNAGDETESGEGKEQGDDGLLQPEEDFVQQTIVVATDMHYLAEDLAGNRGAVFMDMVQNTDGRVLQYGWEIMDSFLEDVLEIQPDLVLLSGDLTLNGEKKSHEELAEKLEVLTDHDIEVIVIPGNHDINHPSAVDFTPDGRQPVETITAEEFEEIYWDYGYRQADSRDPNSLSYLYKLDDYYWLLMLDSCQYDPVNQIGGMIDRSTYQWIDDVLYDSWEQGAQVISVSHHNLLDQSGVSREFYDDCTIEHHEELLELLAGYDVRLHLSGHLHLQHYIEDEDYGIYEIVTGSLVMAPCHYGLLQIWNDGTYRYDAQETDVSAWAKKQGYRNNQDLLDFKSYCQNFLAQISYRNAREDLKENLLDRGIYISNEDLNDMARYYAELCVHYFGGSMHEIEERVKQETAYQKWNAIEYASDISDFLKNILEDEPKDFDHLVIPY